MCIIIVIDFHCRKFVLNLLYTQLWCNRLLYHFFLEKKIMKKASQWLFMEDKQKYRKFKLKCIFNVNVKKNY